MALRPIPKLTPYRGNALVTGPAVEPVTADELRTYLRETSASLSDDDANDFITEARELIEESTGLALITQTWMMALDHWPSTKQEPWWDGVRQGSIPDLYGCNGQVYLPRYPLQSVSGVAVYNEAGTATDTLVQSTLYSTTFDANDGWILLDATIGGGELAFSGSTASALNLGLGITATSYRITFKIVRATQGSITLQFGSGDTLATFTGADANGTQVVDVDYTDLGVLDNVRLDTTGSFDGALTSFKVEVINLESTFDVDTYQRPGRLALKSGQTWPVATRPTNGVEISYVAGYGDNASDVPKGLRRAVKQLAARLYQSRGDGCDADDLMSGVKQILARYSVARL
ncbi:MAG: hypothetical protein MJH10_09995 [Epibacterium sp.]|nr:hypothetical protein [Epibacterium sp.]NQX73868.1 hypothetical protein [Epibacterium sp.]